MGLENDEGEIQRDSWGIKKLFSYGCHKSGGDKDLNSSPIRRASQLNFHGSKHAKFQYVFDGFHFATIHLIDLDHN